MLYWIGWSWYRQRQSVKCCQSLSFRSPGLCFLLKGLARSLKEKVRVQWGSCSKKPKLRIFKQNAVLQELRKVLWQQYWEATENIPTMGFQSWHSLSWDFSCGLYLSNSVPDKRSKLHSDSAPASPATRKDKEQGCPFSTLFPHRLHCLCPPSSVAHEILSTLPHPVFRWILRSNILTVPGQARALSGLLTPLCSVACLPCLPACCLTSDISSAPVFSWLHIYPLQKTPSVSALFCFSLNLFFAIPAHLHSHTLLLMCHPWVPPILMELLTGALSPLPTLPPLFPPSMDFA